MGKKNSIWTDEAAVRAAFFGAKSMTQILSRLRQPSGSASYAALKLAAKAFDLEIPRYVPDSSHLKPFIATSLDEILVEGSTYSRPHLKRRLISEGLLEEKCAICGMPPEWNGLPLSLQLDHINGAPKDNRLENLRLLCPNCHSQTETFAGRATKGRRVPKVKIPCKCGKLTASGRCRVCARLGMSKINWPEDEDLKLMVKEHGYVGTGRILGVSDNAVRKQIGRNNGIRTRQRDF